MNGALCPPRPPCPPSHTQAKLALGRRWLLQCRSPYAARLAIIQRSREPAVQPAALAPPRPVGAEDEEEDEEEEDESDEEPQNQKGEQQPPYHYARCCLGAS
jgi:hypothetical protein